MNVDEDDIKEYFSENEWNVVTDGEKTLFNNFSSTADVFDIKKVDVKEEPREIHEEYCGTDEKDVDQDIGAFEIYCKSDVQENLLDERDVEIKSDQEPEISDCNVYKRTCEDICSKCQIFTYSWHNTGGRGKWHALPKYLLEVRKSNEAEGIFALQTIPEGIQFGPCDGLERTQRADGFAWKLNNGKFVNAEKNMEDSHWMQKVNCAKVIVHQNLVVFQWEGNLYYRSKCQIAEGEELLFHYGEDYDDNFDAASERSHNPPVEKYIEDVYACISCNLGFCSQTHLVNHQSMCPRATTSSDSQEIVQCALCRIYLDEKDYWEFHKDRCPEIYSRNPISSPLTDRSRVKELPSTSCDIGSDAGGPGGASPACAKPDDAHHEVARADLTPFECEICNGCFTTKRNLKVHVKLHAGENCKINLEEHVNTHDGTTPHKCEICDVCFTRDSSLKRHNRIHSGQKTVACHQCDFTSNWESSLKEHVKHHEGIKPYKCEICGKCFTRKPNLKIHILIHSGDKPFACRQCDYRTSNKYHLDKHLLIHNGEKPFACRQCDYRSNQKNSLKRHVKTHEVIKPYTCEICDKCFARKDNFKSHILIHSGEKPFACRQCDFRSNRRNNLKEHMKHHEGIKPYKCEVCGKCFAQKGSFNSHVRIHSDENAFACHQCDYRSSYKHHLDKHVETHAVDKAFACHQCHYRSNHKNNLKEHLKTHDAVKPYKCEVCGKCFTRRGHFNSHSLIHTDEKPFACRQCDFRSNHKKSLTRHMQIHEATRPRKC